MAIKVLLDTVYIIRLFGSNLFEKAMKSINIHLVPAVLLEIKSTRLFELERLIEEGKVILEEINGGILKFIAILIKRHKGKEQATNFLKGRIHKMHDLGEFEIMAFVHQNCNDGYYILTLDKNAKKMMKREPKIKPWVVPEKNEKEILGFSDEDMTNLRRGYS